MIPGGGRPGGILADPEEIKTIERILYKYPNQRWQQTTAVSKTLVLVVILNFGVTWAKAVAEHEGPPGPHSPDWKTRLQRAGARTLRCSNQWWQLLQSSPTSGGSYRKAHSRVAGGCGTSELRASPGKGSSRTGATRTHSPEKKTPLNRRLGIIDSPHGVLLALAGFPAGVQVT